MPAPAMPRFRRRRSNGGVMVDALLAAAAVSAPPSPVVGVPFVFAQPAPDAVVEPGPAKKRRRKDMPPEYVKGPGKVGYLHPIWRRSFPDDEEDAKGRGNVVWVPPHLQKHGVWRRVPGFWKILASADGHIMTEGDSCVRTPSVSVSYYFLVNCNGKMEKVNLLVGRAFHGRPTPDQASIDHKGGKELPPEERRQDNRATNLRWATRSEQNANQGENRKAQSSGEPCIVWEVVGRAGGHQHSMEYMTPVVGPAQRFPSLTAAAKTLGLNHGSMSAIFNGTKGKTVLGADGKRYTGKWTPDHSNLPGEKWKVYYRSEQKALRVSNYGRIQWGFPGRWGHMHYPESSENGYLPVIIDDEHKLVHVLVGELFFIGPKPLDWACWDHKDLDKQNNHIGNLRPVTREDNGVNREGQRDFYLWPKDDPDNWVWCVSQIGTARAYNINAGDLNTVLHKRPNKHGSVSKTVGGYCAAFCDEVD